LASYLPFNSGVTSTSELSFISSTSFAVGSTSYFLYVGFSSINVLYCSGVACSFSFWRASVFATFVLAFLAAAVSCSTDFTSSVLPTCCAGFCSCGETDAY
jgi:hypothetical protein